MNLDWRKIGIVALIIAAVFLLIFLIYWFFYLPIFKTPTTTTTPVATTTVGVLPAGQTGGNKITISQPGELTPAEIAKNLAENNPSAGDAPSKIKNLAAITDSPSYFSTVGADGQIIYYNPLDCLFHKVDENGNTSALSAKKFCGVSNATFDAAGDRAVIQYPDGSNTVYDFNGNRQIVLPSHWQDFSFDPTGQQITFKNMALDPENRSLVTAKYDGTNVKIIEDVGENAYKVKDIWSPTGQIIATLTESKDASRQEIYFIGQNNENFRSMIVEGYGFDGQFSPSGQKIVYSVYDPNNNYKPQLWISDASGDSIGSNRQKIDLQTWSDKCTFAGETKIVCAVPSQMPDGAGIGRDETMSGVPDTLWVTDLTTGTTGLLAIPDSVTTINKIVYSPSSPDKIFVVGDNQLIYKTDLK